jgi:uncharacterized protein HemX
MSAPSAIVALPFLSFPRGHTLNTEGGVVVDVMGIANIFAVAAVGLLLIYQGRERFAQLDTKLKEFREEARSNTQQPNKRIDQTNERLDQTNERIDRYRVETFERIDRVEAKLEGQIGATNWRIEWLEDFVRGEVRAVRSDLTRIALAVGAEPRSDTG